MTQRAFGVGFRSFLAWGTRAGPHTPCQKLGTFHESAHLLDVEGGGFGKGGMDPRVYVSPSHPLNGLIFFPRATMTVASTRAKFFRVSTLYGFSTIFSGENP